MNYLEEKLMPVMGKIASNKYIKSIRDGLAIVMPLIMVGSLFMILTNVPVNGYTDFMNRVFGPNFLNWLSYPLRVTFDLVAVVAVFSISFQIARENKVDTLTAGILSVVAYLLLIPVVVVNETLKNGNVLNLGKVLPTLNLSASGLIVAILTSIIVTEIFTYIYKKNWTIKMPDSVPPGVAKSFEAIIPAFIIITIFLIIRIFFEITSYQTIFTFITKFVGSPLSKVGLSFGGMLATVLSYQLFWSVGIHGTRVVLGVLDSILLPAMNQNSIAFLAHKAIPNIVTRQFYDNFVDIGGCGSTLGLMIVIFFFTKSKQLRSLGKLALVPSFFNISEPIIFGLPVVLNPIMMIPFILSNTAVGAVTYISMALGLVSKPAGIAVPWTVPVFASGFLSTGGDWRAIVLQAVNILVSFLIWLPFILAYDRQKVKEEENDETVEMA
ncbi:PTS cellobiose transporter subunit IIC [Thermoanaerobacterium thermosaccharolyticum]|uniref:PTS cellobiose transporter subunit IIC n=1 Tax=Thermoanaerobacterium thermosaccharolyticum TaxID=1517 RepID=UPI003D2C7D08